MFIKHTLRRFLVALAVVAASLTGLGTAQANDYFLYGNPGYTFPGSPQGDPFTPPPPQTTDMASALQSSLGKPVTIVSSQPNENTSLAPKTADQSVPPFYGYGPGSNGTVQNPSLNQTVLSGIVRANIHWVGTDRILGRVDLNRYVVRLFTATNYYDALLKVTSNTGSTTPGDYYSATWSFQEVSAPRAINNSLLNISSRAQVFTGSNVMIIGFAIQGSTSKTVIIRGIGPSLANFGITGVMSNPTLELRNTSNQLLASNNDWQDSQASQIQATGLQPSDSRESAILITLSPGSYTVILQGYSGGTGVATCDLYDLSPSTSSEIVNLSSRVYVSTDPNALFAGMYVGDSGGSVHVIIRAIGPSLGNYGVVGALQDPTMEVRNANGTLIISNNNWQDNSQQAAAVQATGLAPSDSRESACSLFLVGGSYTAIVRGVNGTSGVGVVDMYRVVP